MALALGAVSPDWTTEGVVGGS